MTAKRRRAGGKVRADLCADFREKYEAGATIRELAESTGWSYGFVYRVLRESEVTLRGRGSRKPVESNKCELIEALYQQGQSPRDIADLMDVSHGMVRNVVRAAGIMRTAADAQQVASQRKAARSKIAMQDIETLAMLWLRGTEPEVLAEQIQVPADLLWEAVATWLSDRPRGDPTTTQTCDAVCAYSRTGPCATRAQATDRTNTHSLATQWTEQEPSQFRAAGSLPDEGAQRGNCMSRRDIC